ncbi:hypothetical protein [Halorubellus sp. PRR65]|uniref:DUF7511 domain-containing protein n=1 Tax=Halorubellus sp. PRR65 TaxID=3098148 RepID=UPI002B260F32|nr:hypothetical protein [Halorubellus sp. PRR65]
MTRTVERADARPAGERATALSGEHDADSDEYTVYPTCAGDDDLVTTWLTVDANAVVDVTDWR